MHWSSECGTGSILLVHVSYERVWIQFCGFMRPKSEHRLVQFPFQQHNTRLEQKNLELARRDFEALRPHLTPAPVPCCLCPLADIVGTSQKYLHRLRGYPRGSHCAHGGAQHRARRGSQGQTHLLGPGGAGEEGLSLRQGTGAQGSREQSLLSWQMTREPLVCPLP